MEKQKTALMMSIERKESHLKWIKEKLTEELSSDYRRDLMLKEQLYEKEIHLDKQLLPAEREHLIDSYEYGRRDNEFLTDPNDWFNQTYGNHEQ